jgi:hypothetical protein
MGRIVQNKHTQTKKVATIQSQFGSRRLSADFRFETKVRISEERKNNKC